MRQYLNLIEALLNEIDRGGEIDSRGLTNIQTEIDRTDFDPEQKQLDLFPDTVKKISQLYKVVGKINNYYVLQERTPQDYGDTVTYVLCAMENNAVLAIGFICLTPTDSRYTDYPQRLRSLGYSLHGSGMQVSGIYIDRSHAGQNLAIKMYDWVLRNVCDYLVSDYMQTRGGEAIWKKLLNSRRFDVRVFDDDRNESRKRWAGKDWENVYSSNKSFRLIPWVTLAGKADRIIYDDEE